MVGYRAYISYSHSDVRFAAWLQRRIETYRVPARIATSKGLDHLKPVFRDRADLPSSANLSDSLQEAIAQSEALVVICSRRAAESRWVGQEIELFRQAHGGDRIFAVIADDAPPACFPAALLVDAAGQAIEPIAADARRGFDGRHDASLKIIAGLLGVPFDGLKQRDLRRQVRRRTIATATAGLVAAVTLYLAVIAQEARDNAERRRIQAEGLISFMLGDLRSRLEPIGRLDLLDAVGDQAMNYFGSLEDGELTPEARLGNAQALRQIGEVRLSQGDLERAFDAFSMANEQTRQLIDSHTDAERAEFELSQSHFWVGYVHLERGNVAMARSHFERYLALSRSLLNRRPESTEYRTELAYALSNLGTLELAEGRTSAAEDYFRSAAEISEALLDQDPSDRQRLDDLANTWSWLGAVASESGDLESAIQWYEKEYGLRARVADDPAGWLEMELLANTAVLLGHHQLLGGRFESAHRHFVDARDYSQRLVEHDPANTVWQRLRGFAQVALARSCMVQGELDAALDYANLALADLLPLADAAPENASLSADLLAALAQRARALRASGDDKTARSVTTRILARYGDQETEDKRSLVEMANVHLLDGDFHQAEGHDPEAIRAWQTGLALLNERPGDGGEVGATLARMLLSERLGDAETTRRLWQRMLESGYDSDNSATIAQALVSGIMAKDR